MNKDTKIIIILCAIILTLLCLHNPHISDYKGFCFPDGITLAEMGSCTVCCFGFIWFFLNKKGKYHRGRLYEFYNGKPEKEDTNNRFYCWLMFSTAIVILILDIHLLNKNYNCPKDISNALKVWEIAAYVVTTIYTYWFWKISIKGWDILDTLTGNKRQINRFLDTAIWSLNIFAAFHTVMFFSKIYLNRVLSGFFEHYEALISLVLIVVVYFLFCKINKRIIKYAKQPNVQNEFSLMHRYIDTPVRATFIILLGIACYAWYLDRLALMENFFSGAIAFELILSSIVWSNTNTF